MTERTKPRIGASACLLGHPVRFDGGHKRRALLTQLAAEFVDFTAICPEVEIGLATPRPTIQLRRSEQQIRLVTSKAPHDDLTERMVRYAEEKVAKLGDLDGFIFKKDSPSCGMTRVPVVINDAGYRDRSGVGLFAETFMRRWPLIPVEDEGRLNDAAIRENFFERVFAYQRWKAIPNAENNIQGLMNFHARHKLQLMARGSSYYRELGRLVAGTTHETLAQKRTAYVERFMPIMAMRPSRGNHVNVLQHIQGFLKHQLEREDKRELAHLYEAFRQRHVPLVTPLTLIRHHIRRHACPYLASQHYLAPFPDALALRSVL